MCNCMKCQTLLEVKIRALQVRITGKLINKSEKSINRFLYSFRGKRLLQKINRLNEKIVTMKKSSAGV